jgi:hypothetical protein
MYNLFQITNVKPLVDYFKKRGLSEIQLWIDSDPLSKENKKFAIVVFPDDSDILEIKIPFSLDGTHGVYNRIGNIGDWIKAVYYLNYLVIIGEGILSFEKGKFRNYIAVNTKGEVCSLRNISDSIKKMTKEEIEKELGHKVELI